MHFSTPVLVGDPIFLQLKEQQTVGAMRSPEDEPFPYPSKPKIERINKPNKSMRRSTSLFLSAKCFTGASVLGSLWHFNPGYQTSAVCSSPGERSGAESSASIAPKGISPRSSAHLLHPQGGEGDSVGLVPLHRSHPAPLPWLYIQQRCRQLWRCLQAWEVFPAALPHAKHLESKVDTSTPGATRSLAVQTPSTLQISQSQHSTADYGKNIFKSLRCRALHYLGSKPAPTSRSLRQMCPAKSTSARKAPVS